MNFKTATLILLIFPALLYSQQNFLPIIDSTTAYSYKNSVKYHDNMPNPFFKQCQNDTTYYFGINGKNCDVEKSEIKKCITHISDINIKVETFCNKDGKWISISSEKIKILNENECKIHVNSLNFSGTVTRVFENLGDKEIRFTDWIKRSKIRTGISSSRIPLIFNGEVTEYYKNGNKKSTSLYENNCLVCNKNWLEDGEPYIDSVFYSVDQVPRYKPGVSILHAYVRNAFLSSEIDITQLSGRIVVGFVVLKDGSIDGIQIEEGLNSKLNAIAYKAFCKLPGKWQPARLEGKDVRYYQLFPINFIYREKKFKFTELKGRMF